MNLNSETYRAYKDILLILYLIHSVYGLSTQISHDGHKI